MPRHNPYQLRERANKLLALAKKAREEGESEFAAQLERLAEQAYEEASSPHKQSKKPRSE
jgi:hypothetical protein